MEKQAIATIETTIVETDKFIGKAKAGDEVYIYRRLADIYDKTAIAMLNANDQVIGYLNRQMAEEKILPYLEKGLKFKCVVIGAPDGEGDLPINLSVLAPVSMSQEEKEDLLSTDNKRKRRGRKKRTE